MTSVRVNVFETGRKQAVLREQSILSLKLIYPLHVSITNT